MLCKVRLATCAVELSTCCPCIDHPTHWLNSVRAQITQRKLKGLSNQLREIKQGGDEDSYAPKVMRLIMSLWQSQDLIHGVQVRYTPALLLVLPGS